MLMVNGIKVDEVHMERAKALQAYAYANGMRVPNIRAIVERADKAGMGDRTKGFDYLDNGAPLLA